MTSVIRTFLLTAPLAFSGACTESTTLIGAFEEESPTPTPSGGTSSGGSPTASGGAGADGGAGGEPSTPLLGLSFEAEEGVLSGPFSISRSGDPEIVAVTAEEASAASDSPGDARATYQFIIEEAGEYIFWGRIHSPSTAENRFWFRVDGGQWTLWRISTGEEWFWDDLHENYDYGNPIVFALEAGPHELEFANAVIGAEIDKFHIAPPGELPKMREVTCDPPHSVLLSGQCVRSCGSHGNVSCVAEECVGREELIVYDCAICCSLE